jgi:hypothetical protein
MRKKISKTKKKTHSDDMFGASLGGEHAKDPGSTTDIQDSFPLEQMAIVHDRRTVRTCPDGVLQHLLVDALGKG